MIKGKIKLIYLLSERLGQWFNVQIKFEET